MQDFTEAMEMLGWYLHKNLQPEAFHGTDTLVLIVYRQPRFFKKVEIGT